MARFDADALGKRLEAINRDALAAIERETEELLSAMQRRGPLRADSAAAHARTTVSSQGSEATDAAARAGGKR